MKLWQEKAYPYVGGSVSAVVIFAWLPGRAVVKAMSELPSPLLTVTAISLGFIGTTQAILMSVAGSRLMRKLSEKTAGKKSYLDDLHDYLNTATWWAIGATVFSTVAILFDPVTLHGKRVYFALWVFVSMTAFLCFVRVVRVMSSLLTKLH